MFSLFKDRSHDVKSIRNTLLQFIKEKLQLSQGGEGNNITGIYLFINCSENEKQLYEAALFANTPGRFKTEEVQRIADDYDISLNPSWKLEINFTDKYPSQAEQVQGTHTAVFISTKKAGLNNGQKRAVIKILNGRAEKEVYNIESGSSRINIGREAKVQAAGNYMRQNNIAFTPDETNRAISRQHAHIEWQTDNNSFVVFADEGGIPPYNKMKIRTTNGALIKMQAVEVGHRLQEGDQIILGDSAVLEFSYPGNEG
ncbi:MAG: FHA domain-containing protein [Ferruginibacter sp.]